MKKLGILMDYVNEYNFNSEEYINDFILFSDILKKKNIYPINITYNSFDPSTKTFRSYNDFNNGKFEIINEAIQPDIIRKRVGSANTYCYEYMQDLNLLPSHNISALNSDKWEMYLFMKEYQPNTVLMSRFLEEKSIQNEMGEILIIKPIRSDHGTGVEKIQKNKLIEDNGKYDGLKRLYIVQEFINFRDGYGDMIKGAHDIRMVFIGDKFVYSFLREPYIGDIVKYVGEDVKETSLKVSEIPKEIFEISNNLIKKLKISNKEMFALDFAYCKEKNRWYVIELNYAPGAPEDIQQKQIHFQSLAEYFELNLK